MSVAWSPRALRDVQAIAAYIEERSRVGAASVVSRIELTAALISRYPEAGRALARRPGIRMLPVGKYPYQVFYPIEPTGPVILHIRHSARRSPKAHDLR